METLPTGVQAIEGARERCHCGYVEVLGQLADVFHAIRCHNATTDLRHTDEVEVKYPT